MLKCLTFDLNVRILRDGTDGTARGAGVVVVALAVVIAVYARGGVKIYGATIATECNREPPVIARWDSHEWSTETRKGCQ